MYHENPKYGTNTIMLLMKVFVKGQQGGTGPHEHG